MTLSAAIEKRISRRKYLETEISPSITSALQEKINEYNKIGGFRIVFVLNNGEAFKGFTRSYGMLTGVKHYFGLIADLDDPNADEKIGYYGELLVLHATALGLGTCWVGGTYSKSKVPFEINNDERLACLITVGNVEETSTGREKLIYTLAHRKTKGINEMYQCGDAVEPVWFLNGMSAVSKAPSAMNKQPVLFHLKDCVVTASVKNTSKYLVAFDLGIAKLHFEIGAGGGSWLWGSGGRFIHQKEEKG